MNDLDSVSRSASRFAIAPRSRIAAPVLLALPFQLALVCVAVAVALCACDEAQPGRALAQGLGRDVLVSPGGESVAFFLDAAHPDDRSVPEDLFAGDLWLADIRGASAALKVGAGVPTTPGATVFRPDGGAIAFLASFRFHTGEGELWAASSAVAPRKLADAATSFAWAPRGIALAWIAQSRLYLSANPLEAAKPGASAIARVEGAQSFLWSPDGTSLAVRTQGRGRLLRVAADAGVRDADAGPSGADSGPRELSPDSSDFLFASDGALGALAMAGRNGGDRALTIFEPGATAARLLGRATSFAFSPDGREVLLLSTDAQPGEAFGELSRVARSGGTAQILGGKVNGFRFTAKGALLFLAGYDTRARAGTLMLSPAPGAAAREIARRVQSYQVSPSGDRVLFLVQAASKIDFKVELWTAELAVDAQGFGRAPRKIDEGVYGYQLSPDGTQLFWKSHCAGARACTLYRAPINSAAEPVALAELVAGFDLAPASGRLLIAHPHKAAARAVDLTIQDGFAPPPEHAPKPFISEVDPTSRFLDPAGHTLVAPLLKGHGASVRLLSLP